MASTTLTDVLVLPSILFKPKRHTVGKEQDIKCTATLVSTAEDTVNFTWVTPDGVIIDDERVAILPTTVNENNHISVLKFEYLMESDVGTYKCDIILNNYTTSVSGKLQDIYGKYVYSLGTYIYLDMLLLHT